MRTRTQPRAKHAAGWWDEGILIDSFAGGGGASIGLERAFGRAVDIAVNHDATAITFHQANHPRTLHIKEDVRTADLSEAIAGRPVLALWASPDCTHFAKARGATPVKKEIRGLAGVVVKWARLYEPAVIILENVREFETWGPVIPMRDDAGTILRWPDGSAKCMPCPERKGLTFQRWVGRLRRLGYEVQWRSLDAAAFGAPTHRKRLFLVARRDGKPIVWPEPTHGPGCLYPYRTAAECIDWSLPCPSIFLSPEEGRAVRCNRPLREKTMRRIAMGIKRFVLDNPRPFIVRCDHGGSGFRGQSVDSPLATITGKHGFGVINPAIVGVGGRMGQSPATSAVAPLGTITAKNDRALMMPFMTAQFGEAPGQLPRTHSAEEPLPTITARNGGGFPLIAASLVQYNGEKGNEVRGGVLDEPLNTVTGDPRFALCSAFLAKHYGGVIGHGPDRPIGTITAIDHHSVAAANLVRIGQNGGNGAYVNGSEEPLTTVTSKAEHCLAVSHLSKLYGTSVGADLREPLPTVTGQGNHLGEVRAFLTKYYSTGAIGQSAGNPLGTVTARDRFGVVTVQGQDYVISDIGLRMLRPRELFLCQGFPPDYKIDMQIVQRGRLRPLPISKQVKLCGNSVSPPVAEALVRANFPEECRQAKRRKAAVS